MDCLFHGIHNVNFYLNLISFTIHTHHIADGDGLLVNEDFTTVESWCDNTDDTFFVGDTNGDHHDDWICHHRDGSVCTKYNSLIFGGKTLFIFK